MPTPRQTLLHAALLCAFAGTTGVTQAEEPATYAAPAAATTHASSYRLRIADPQAFRLRTGEQGEEYRLAPQYRSAIPASASGGDPNDPVVKALAAAAHAEMESRPYARQIDKAARAAQLDPALVHAVIYVESRHQAKAISVKGAVGLMQVLPDTGARYGIDPTRTPEQNLKAGTRYLSELMKRFNNRLDLVLAAYNAGEGAVERHANKIPPYRETRDYVRAVLDKYRIWGGPYTGTTTSTTTASQRAGGAPPVPPAFVARPPLIAYGDGPRGAEILQVSTDGSSSAPVVVR